MLPITRDLAQWALDTGWSDLPPAIQAEAVDAFLNWVGCALGGSAEEVTAAAEAACLPAGGAPSASMLGRGRRTDVISAAFVNCVASSALAYDDTHIATVTHPTGPVAAVLLAHAETTPIRGQDLLAALAVGIEIQCRMSNVLLLPPSSANLSLYVTGITGPIGAAAALGRVMGFDLERMRWAIGHAATQAAGFRATHGAMSGLVVPAFGARAGAFSVHMAAAGLVCRDNVLEAPKGLVEVYSTGADLGHATRGLGEVWEMSANTYKPYPCGIVVQPAIDACREIASQMRLGDQVEKARLFVHPLAIGLADRVAPKDQFEAQISLQHWAACVFLRGTFGIAEMRQAVIDDPAIAALRRCIDGVADGRLGRDQARAEVTLQDGRILTAMVEASRGSMSRKMTRQELDDKFLTQARVVLRDAYADGALDLLRTLPAELDVGRALIPLLA